MHRRNEKPERNLFHPQSFKLTSAYFGKTSECKQLWKLYTLVKNIKNEVREQME